jgi:hypothetical protein
MSGVSFGVHVQERAAVAIKPYMTQEESHTSLLKQQCSVRFDVSMAVSMKMVIFWVLVLCRLVSRGQRLNKHTVSISRKYTRKESPEAQCQHDRYSLYSLAKNLVGLLGSHLVSHSTT